MTDTIEKLTQKDADLVAKYALQEIRQTFPQVNKAVAKLDGDKLVVITTLGKTGQAHATYTFLTDLDEDAIARVHVAYWNTMLRVAPGTRD